MEIRKLEVDYETSLLRINGEKVMSPVIVTLPGPEGWPLEILINPEQVTTNPEKYARLRICYQEP